MSRLNTFVAVGVILVLSIYAQRLAVDLLGPTSTFWQMIADITWPVDGDQWAQQMYVAISVWFIWIIRVGAIVIALYREFTRQNVTRRTAGGRPP